MDTVEFETALRQHVDAHYEREPAPDNPFQRLIRGELSQRDCCAAFAGLWPSLVTFNRVLLPRLLAKAPSVPLRVELMNVIAQEYGPALDVAHPVLLKNFLTALGVDPIDLPWDTDIEYGPTRAEVAMLRGFSWCELLARILVGESVGPVAFPAVAAALEQSYGLSGFALRYFTVHAKTDKKDTEILFSLLRREAVTADDRERVFTVIDRSFEEGRYKLYGCRLDGTTDYRYADRLGTIIDNGRD